MILRFLYLDHLENSGAIHGSNRLTDFYSFSCGIRRNYGEHHNVNTQIQALEQVIFFSSSYQG